VKRWIGFLYLLMGFVWAETPIDALVGSGELVIYVPSHGYLVEGLRFMYSHFYGANFQQKWAELSAQSVAGYGVDFLEAKSLASVGIATNLPIVFVHVKDDKGYLALPLAQRKTFEAYVKKNFSSVALRFVSNYVLLSQNSNAFEALATPLVKEKGFLLATSRLPDVWRNGWVWFESRYLSSMTRGTGVSDKVNLPSGFGLVSVIFQPQNLIVKSYTASFDKEQESFLYQLQNFENTPRFAVLDYVRGNPMLIGRVNLNLSLLYRYYRLVDKLDMMGIASLVADLKQKYNVDLERDLIQNSEGRLNLVIDRFSQGQFLYYGSLGIKNKLVVQNFMESLKNMVLQKQEELYAFEIFTVPFYRYKMTNGSFYFGVLENEFFFASDKDLLVQCIKDIYEKKSGNSLPMFFSSPRQRAGLQAFVDVQSMLSSLGQDTGLRLAKDFFVGVKNIEIESYPDTTAPAYGWTTEVRLNFYR